MVLRAQPACVVCGAPATDVDHITPKRLGGRDDMANLQALCHSCHTRKTMRERRGE
jgi:5-methylcytosine-specific restriction protein A